MAYTLRDATNADVPAVKRIVTTVLAEYGLTADPCGIDRDLDDLEQHFGTGVFKVVEAADGTIVGCGGLLRMSDAEGEIRKMYLLPAARGHGLGKRMLRELIARAREMGMRRVVLETASVLTEAIALYRSHGFVRTERADMTDRCDQAWVLELDVGAGSRRE